MNRRRFVIAIFFIVLAGAIIAVMWSESTSDERLEDSATGPAQQAPSSFAAASGREGDVSPADDDQAVPAPESGYMLRFSIASSKRVPGVEATIGLAGMYPPGEANAPAGGLVPLPGAEVSTMWGDEPASYEVLARTFDRRHAFWGDVSVEGESEPAVLEQQLEEASPLQVTIVDERGEPVPDAEVRVSRGFIGLVHLTKRAGADGAVVFDGLPEADFRLTVQADGFARQMQRLSHAKDNKAIEIALEEGPTEIGNGELERLAREVVVSGNRTVVPTSGDDGDEDRDEDRTDGRRRPLDLYVVDQTGSPVSGALMQLWEGGRKLHEQSSGGSEPIRVELATPFRGTLVAFDGRRGEGSVPVVLAEGTSAQEIIVRLDRDLLTLDLPPGRINSRYRIEDILGVDLVRDDDALLADVTSAQSPAARAGIERGDRVVYLREVGDGYSVLIERGSERLQVPLPAGN